jgi:formylmethanofuran dehydrogenase subunit E
MPPTAALQEALQDTRKPARATCTQCGECVEHREPKPAEKPLCADCAFDNVPFTD